MTGRPEDAEHELAAAAFLAAVARGDVDLSDPDELDPDELSECQRCGHRTELVGIVRKGEALAVCEDCRRHIERRRVGPDGPGRRVNNRRRY